MIYLLYRPHALENGRNSNNINTVIVNADDEATARERARDAAPDGETKIRAGWACVPLDELDGVVFVNGDVYSSARLVAGVTTRPGK